MLRNYYQMIHCAYSHVYDSLHQAHGGKLVTNGAILQQDITGCLYSLSSGLQQIILRYLVANQHLHIETLEFDGHWR